MAITLEDDHKRLQSGETAEKKLAKSVLAMMDHMITGNSIDKLKGARDELQAYIIDR